MSCQNTFCDCGHNDTSYCRNKYTYDEEMPYRFDRINNIEYTVPHNRRSVITNDSYCSSGKSALSCDIDEMNKIFDNLIMTQKNGRNTRSFNTNKLEPITESEEPKYEHIPQKNPQKNPSLINTFPYATNATKLKFSPIMNSIPEDDSHTQSTKHKEVMKTINSSKKIIIEEVDESDRKKEHLPDSSEYVLESN